MDNKDARTDGSPKRLELFETRVPSVDRALDVLELLAGSARGLTLSDISRTLQIPRSSAHYLIQSLLCRGYLARSPAGREYVLGLRVANLTPLTPAQSELRAVCSPYLTSLAKELGLTAQVGVLGRVEAVVIDRADSLADVRFDSWVGRHFDLHCTALGKALIAHLSDAQVERLFQGRGLPRHNRNTLCSLTDVKAHLADVRTRGYAIDNEEHELGVRCIAAPIFNNLRSVVAAVCVFSSVTKLPEWHIPIVGRRVVSAASDISRYLREPLFMSSPRLGPSGAATLSQREGRENKDNSPLPLGEGGPRSGG
jgi:DNA-binding IclR family transcriptional regulator